jgi:hypothetical protein
LKKTRAGPANDVMDGRDFVTYSTTFHFRYPSLDRSDILERHALTSCRKPPVLSILWYIQNEHDIYIYIWGDNVKSKKLHDYALKRSANYKLKVDKNWVRRGSRDWSLRTNFGFRDE